MASWDEAFLILKKWRDEKSPLEYSDVIPLETPQGETTIASGQHFVRVVSVSPASVTFRFEGSLEEQELELIGATFEYMDSRETPFPDSPAGKYVCTLEIERPDGRLVIFSERSKEFGF